LIRIMPHFQDWLEGVLARGEAVLESRPVLSAEERPAAAGRLHEAYELHALDVAGPPIGFDERTAVWAATVLAEACWSLVAGGEAGDSPEWDREPVSPADHLSADLTLRFLPAVHARARSLEPMKELAARLESLLRRWPLSGVLANLDGGPAAGLGFAGHAGLQLLYAERQVGSGRPGWVPAAGRAREWAERIHAERGKPLPSAPAAPTETADA
jgi:hypothetical protein